jgi:hypothetical protein
MGTNQCRDKISNAFRDCSKKRSKRKTPSDDKQTAIDARAMKKTRSRQSDSDSCSSSSVPVSVAGPIGDQIPLSRGAIANTDSRPLFDFSRQIILPSLSSMSTAAHGPSMPSTLHSNIGAASDSLTSFASASGVYDNLSLTQSTTVVPNILSQQIGSLPWNSRTASLPFPPLDFAGNTGTTRVAWEQIQSTIDDQMRSTNISNIADGFVPRSYPFLPPSESWNHNTIQQLDEQIALANALDRTGHTVDTFRGLFSSPLGRIVHRGNTSVDEVDVDPFVSAIHDAIGPQQSDEQYDKLQHQRKSNNS